MNKSPLTKEVSPPHEKTGELANNQNSKKSVLKGVSGDLKKSPPRDNKSPRSSLPMISLGATAERIISELARGLNPYAIARKLNCTRKNVTNHLKRMEKNGLVEINFHVWKLTSEGNRYMGGDYYSAVSEREGGTLELSDRAHNIKIKFPVLSAPKDNGWLKGWKARDMRNNTFYYSSLGNIQLQFTGKSIIVQLPSLRFPSAELANMEAGRIATALMKQYERDFNLKLGAPDFHSQIISQHHALQNDPYAEFCRKNGISFDEGGVCVDSSQKGIPELEFTDSSKSHIHADNYIEFIKDTAENWDKSFSLSQASSILKGVILGLSKVEQSQTRQENNFERLQESNIETASGLSAITNLMSSQLSEQKNQAQPQQQLPQSQSSSIESYRGYLG